MPLCFGWHVLKGARSCPQVVYLVYEYLSIQKYMYVYQRCDYRNICVAGLMCENIIIIYRFFQKQRRLNQTIPHQFKEDRVLNISVDMYLHLD